MAKKIIKKKKPADKNATKLLGVDVFIQHRGIPSDIVLALKKVSKALVPLKLSAITNRGTKVWPGNTPSIEMTDVYTCRFLSKSMVPAKSAVQALLSVEKAGFTWVHVEKLFEINGKAGFSAILED